MFFKDLEYASELTPEQVEEQKRKVEARREVIELVIDKIRAAKNNNEKKASFIAKLTSEEKEELARKHYFIEQEYEDKFGITVIRWE